MQHHSKSGSVVRIASVLAAGAAFGAAASGQTALLHLKGTSAGEMYGAIAEEVSAGFVFAPNYELVVGVPEDDTNGVDAGRVDVRSATNGTLLYSLYGTNAGDRFGARVTQADLNGDGRIDYLLVGADQRGTGSPGYLALFDPLTGFQLASVPGTVPDSEFGASMAVVRDLDGDAVNDYLVGAPNEDVGVLVGAGVVHVISGVNNLEIATLDGVTAGGHFGWNVLTLGDVDGDSIPDFAVAAPSEGGMGTLTAYSETSPPVQLWQTAGVNALEDFGEAVLSVSDFDGDSIADLLVGAPALLNPSLPGRVALISGATGGQITDVSGPAPADRFGVAIQIGDANGDGVADVYVGAPGVNGPGTDRGAMVVETLASPGVFSFLGVIVGDVDGDSFGSTLALLPISPRPILGDYVAVGVPGHDEPGLPDCGLTVVYATTSSPAAVQGYGTGWPGTNGIPNLVSSAIPAFETSINLTIDNSAGAPTVALLLAGFAQASIPTRAQGTILVSPPWVLIALALPVGQLQMPSVVPTDVRYCGLKVDLQVLEQDFGASRNISFTPALELTLGG
jgi:hypothetical protein